jgi:hypothetical protein
VHHQHAPQQPQQPQPLPRAPSEGHMPRLPTPTSIPVNSEDYAKALQEAYRKGAEAAAMMAQQQQTQTIPSAASCPNFATGMQVSSSHQSHQPMTGVRAEEAAYAASTAPHQHPTHMSSQSQPTPDQLGSSMPPPPSHGDPTQHHHHHPAHQSIEYSPPAPVKPQVQGRSLSLPDMSAYAAQAEEEKRQKRLARNRASARLRRLRKKNLVSWIPWLV